MPAVIIALTPLTIFKFSNSQIFKLFLRNNHSSAILQQETFNLIIFVSSLLTKTISCI